MSEYGKHFSEENFWEKLAKFAKKAGEKVVETALTLYYCMRDPDTPMWVKTVIVGTLGYFIFPIDAIPDVLGPIGYTDDLGVFVTAMASISIYIKEEHREMARAKMRELFD